MTASPTPPDFFAESAKNPVGLPSEEGLARVLCAEDGHDPDEPVVGGQSTGFQDFGPRWQAEERSENTLGGRNYVRDARAILDLIRPAFEAKERELQAALFASRHETDLCQQALEDRAAAEAKLAQAVEAMAPFDDALGEDDEGYGGGLTVVMKWGACTDYSITLEDLRDLRKAARSAEAMGEKT